MNFIAHKWSLGCALPIENRLAMIHRPIFHLPLAILYGFSYIFLLLCESNNEIPLILLIYEHAAHDTMFTRIRIMLGRKKRVECNFIRWSQLAK